MEQSSTGDKNRSPSNGHATGEDLRNEASTMSNGVSTDVTDSPSATTEDAPLLDSVSQSSGGADSEVSGLGALNRPDDESVSASVSCSSDDETEKPWPSTFERSISLLAGPRLNADVVDKLTKSPKPGIMTARARKSLRNLQRGYGTPDPQQPVPMASPGTPGRIGAFFKRGIEKVQSLDFGPRPSIDERVLAQERKAMEAKAYRQKLLAKQGSKQVTHPPHKDEETGLSPGYHREKQSIRYQRQLTKEAKEKEEKKATFAQCIFNMANILMGVGMLGLPFVFRSAGWLGGFLVTFGFGFVTWRTSVLIGRELNGDPRPGHVFDDSPYKSPLDPGSSPAARMRQPIKSFPDIAREAFGDRGCFLLSAVLYFELYSCLCIFFVTLGDHLHSLFPSVSVTHHMIVVAIVLTIPTALLRTPRLLSYLSAVGTVATVAVVLSVFFSAVFEGDISESVAVQKGVADASPYHTLWRPAGLPIALGLIAYTFSGHAIVPSIYSSMERPQDFERMIGYTFIAVISCCLLVAASGYYMFGSVVEDQITISLAEAGTNAQLAMKMLTWLMILTAFSKFTLTMFPLALGIEEIVAPYVPSEKVMGYTDSLIKMVLIVLSLLVAIFVPSFSFLCSLVGLICTMIVSAIFPAAAHLKLFGHKLSTADKVLDWIFVVGGSIMAVVGTVATVGI